MRPLRPTGVGHDSQTARGSWFNSWTGSLLLFGPASSSVLSLGFHGGQSSIECSNPCGDGRFLSYSL